MRVACLAASVFTVLGAVAELERRGCDVQARHCDVPERSQLIRSSSSLRHGYGNGAERNDGTAGGALNDERDGGGRAVAARRGTFP